MTHDELLAEINRLDNVLTDSYGMSALRAVVELHRPEEQDHKQYEKCWNCNLLYPCPTIQTITEELK